MPQGQAEGGVAVDRQPGDLRLEEALRPDLGESV